MAQGRPFGKKPPLARGRQVAFSLGPRPFLEVPRVLSCSLAARLMSTAQKQPDPNIGRSILNGQFLIEQKIGSGGMGAVYKALQPAMNRMVAVKILHPKLANRKDLVSRFRREARAMSHLSHPNTVKVYLLWRAGRRLPLHRHGVPGGAEPQPGRP
jgi:serine/threonine protein kinase